LVPDEFVGRGRLVTPIFSRPVNPRGPGPAAGTLTGFSFDAGGGHPLDCRHGFITYT